MESELRSLVPGRDRFFPRPRAIKKFKKVVRAVIFASRLKKTNMQTYGEAYLRKRMTERLCDNWNNQRYYWDLNIK
jgi:hypothetical protein